MSTLFDEHQADKEVIESLLKTNRTLWHELEESRSVIKSLQELTNRRKQPMSKILQDSQGRLYIAHRYELLTEEIARDLVGIFSEELPQLETFLGNLDNSNPVPAASADQAAAPSDQSLPADPSQLVAAPAAPVLDANGNPIQTAPAPDPSQAQPQPEQPVMPPLQ